MELLHSDRQVGHLRVVPPTTVREALGPLKLNAGAGAALDDILTTSAFGAAAEDNLPDLSTISTCEYEAPTKRKRAQKL